MTDDGASPTGPVDEAAQALCRVVRDLHARGWCFGTSSNFSVTLRETLAPDAG